MLETLFNTFYLVNSVLPINYFESCESVFKFYFFYLHLM